MWGFDRHVNLTFDCMVQGDEAKLVYSSSTLRKVIYLHFKSYSGDPGFIGTLVNLAN